ncbi:hypothetical protein POJ06DRAFT_58286 [Lipomyces tetrasporus]|uniref:Uncharacterized protein n=1 Tax=Lipomyces tetrasporus TaxID=54092 RepID=A0AAD7VVE2_9ASCO|nr:uncharacterized protein POJ06DRAFT_58286 [Lipomyces tetrasporus]KAJ8102879.1 hypothetical protein POJ06DRAFT_58286 [Lipomyces tetrasporus]
MSVESSSKYGPNSLRLRTHISPGPTPDLEVFRCPVCDKKFLSKSQRSVREHVARLMKADTADGRAHAEYHEKEIKRTRRSEEERRRSSAAAQQRYRARKSIDAQEMAEKLGGPSVIYDKAKVSDKKAGIQRQALKRKLSIPKPQPPKDYEVELPKANPFLYTHGQWSVSFLNQLMEHVPLEVAKERVRSRLGSDDEIENTFMELAKVSVEPIDADIRAALDVWKSPDRCAEAYSGYQDYQLKLMAKLGQLRAYEEDLKAYSTMVESGKINEEELTERLQAWAYRQRFLHSVTSSPDPQVPGQTVESMQGNEVVEDEGIDPTLRLQDLPSGRG